MVTEIATTQGTVFTPMSQHNRFPAAVQSRVGTPLQTMLGEYLLFCQVEGKSPRTIRWYRQKLDYLLAFLTKHGLPTHVERITQNEIRRFVHHLQTEVQAGENNPRRRTQDKGLSAHTIAGYVRTLRAFFSWAVREGRVDESPMKHVGTPKVPALAMPFFTDEEIERLLKAAKKPGYAGKRNHTMLLVLLDTGIRVSELVNLQINDLYLEAGYFKVFGKGSKERIVPQGKSSRKALAEYVRRHRPAHALAGGDAVFLTHSGYPLTPDYVYKIVSRACREADIQAKRLGPHTCRHTFARNFLLNGGDLLTLQRILGHSSLEVVKLYVRLDTRDLLAQQWKYSPMDTLRARRSARPTA